MSSAPPRPQDLLSQKLSDLDPESWGRQTGTVAEELAQLRQTVERLEHMLAERDHKGATLIEGYRGVITDLTKLIEMQRSDAVKRDESVRFLLQSIEARLLERATGGKDVRAVYPRRRDKGGLGRVFRRMAGG